MTDIDLMTDCKFSEDGEPRATFHIVQFDSNHFNVVYNGTVATALTWGEMLEQIISLCHPDLSRAQYRMLTREEFVADRQRHQERVNVA